MRYWKALVVTSFAALAQGCGTLQDMSQVPQPEETGDAGVHLTATCPTSLRGMNVSSRDFSHCKMVGADLNGATGIHARFVEANLVRALFRGATMTSADFSHANLTQADFIGATGAQARFVGANLVHALFRGANMASADFSHANLAQANLFGANFQGADLSGANLSNADARGTNFHGADLRGANLSGLVTDANTNMTGVRR